MVTWQQQLAVGVNDTVGVAVMNPYIIVIIEQRIPKNGQNTKNLVVTVHKNQVHIQNIFSHSLALQFLNRYHIVTALLETGSLPEDKHTQFSTKSRADEIQPSGQSV